MFLSQNVGHCLCTVWQKLITWPIDSSSSQMIEKFSFKQKCCPGAGNGVRITQYASCLCSGSLALANEEANTYLIVALCQDLVVLAERHQEDDGGDVLKAVDPLPPL